MANDTAIKVEHVSKTFKLPHEKNTSIKSAIVNFYRRKRTFEEQQVLQDISFEIKKGEFFGIVGRNGSGKSTLLKLIAGIYHPSEGALHVRGKLTPFIELGVGFNPELTGRENVYLNGALLGFSRKEMSEMYDDIVEFAEIERFMDQKLKNYSSGMQVRLAFSIAIRAKSDILLIDEVLAVGDIAFQKKCLDYFDELKKKKQTVILVSHDMGTVEEHCSQALLINDGKVVDAGSPKKIAAQYRILNLPKKKQKETPKTTPGDFMINDVRVNGSKAAVVDGDDEIVVDINCTPIKTKKYIVSLSITRSDDKHIAYYDTRKELKKPLSGDSTPHTLTCRFGAKQFLKGAYKIDIDVRDENDIYLASRTGAVSFSVTNDDTDKAGVLNLDGTWSVGDPNL